MLTRQLASAGSGKTYTLAKQFILLFITIPADGDGGEQTARRLRTRAELTDSLRHILAITFTNKATGEMKQRIISKLAALAGYRAPVPADGRALTAEEMEADRKRRADTDYLDEFADTLGVPHEEVARVAGQALEILLNEFSDFQVSTIDSFFQLVMRTFTYEAELPDNFQLELDSNYVAGLGLDSALTDLNTSRSSDQFRYWASKTVETELNSSGRWNLFAPGARSIYNKVLDMLKTMESESFKERLKDLREYFDDTEGLGEGHPGGYIGRMMAHFDTIYIQGLRNAASDVRKAARAVLDYMAAHRIDGKDMARFLHSRIVKMSQLNWKKGYEGSFNADSFIVSSEMKKGVPSDPELLAMVHRIGEKLADYTKRAESRETRSWMVYSDAIRRLALTWEIKKKIDELMLDANSLQLSDTNSILRTIIGDDETPFIYERLGAKLDHFLIDEFQDTSRLQWENTLPLLRESEGRGKENLIIGDPKQSIYRFRNADSSLITTAVKHEFPRLHDAGVDPKTNTNWRSELNIVRFNNFLFHSLATMGMDYTSSYGDVIQFSSKYKVANPEKTRKNGYVRMRFFKKGEDTLLEDNTEEEETDYPEYYSEIGPIIMELMDRGYRQRDIAILVNTHKVGGQVISALLDFNSRVGLDGEENGARHIRFVSEDSLKVSNARGVKTVLEALRAIDGSIPFTRPANIKPVEEEESDTEASKANEEAKDPIEKYGIYADKEIPRISEDLREMLARMSVVTLPALVEQIIATFVPDAIRRSEAPFLAAFQDTVLEFSETHLADISSFLKWWGKHGEALSISSPETTDAVQVVTVHSSKGLEFGAVIIPDANYSFSPAFGKVETAWLTPLVAGDAEFRLPPTLPIEINGDLDGTLHENVLFANRKDVATDKLNAAYVAFTRARYELHILSDIARTSWPENPEDEDEKSKRKSRKSDDIEEDVEKIPAVASLAKGIFETFLNSGRYLDTVPSSKLPYVIEEDDLSVEFDTMVSLAGNRMRETLEITYGEPFDLGLKRSQEEAKGGDEDVLTSSVVSDYSVNDSFPALHFEPETSLPVVDDEAEEETDAKAPDATGDEDPEELYEDEIAEEDEIIPGSELALLREVLGRLAVVRDLDRAMLPMKVCGRWTAAQLDYIRGLLSAFIDSAETREYMLPPEGWTVYANRPLVHRRRKTRIPDRIHISPDGERALVINFKLTREPEEREWTQLRSHMRALRKTGFEGRIEAWLCHLPEGICSRLTGDLGRKFGKTMKFN
ncbi:MAG: UvrD-helicase domain-containing protein [Bacteroidales bacterium]|nr:UvrD-helicase domain-containing protein [Bacteroidales bacterium]